MKIVCTEPGVAVMGHPFKSRLARSQRNDRKVLDSVLCCAKMASVFSHTINSAQSFDVLLPVFHWPWLKRRKSLHLKPCQGGL